MLRRALIISVRRGVHVFLARMLLAMVLGVAVASGAAAEELRELRDAFVFEASLLDADIDEYAAARERERQAIDELRQVNQSLDDGLADPNVSPAELIGLNGEAARLRAAACGRARETEEARRGLFERMRSMRDLVQKVEQLGVEIVAPSGEVGGMWKVEAQPTDLYGLMSLEQNGSLVEGSYRLSNGRRGSMRGTFAGNRLELDMIDSERGKIGTVEGELDDGAIQGRWNTLELAAGRPAAGEWTAVWVSLETVLDL